MIHLFMALHAEAEPLIRALPLHTVSRPGPFRSWTDDSSRITLTLTGPGPYAAAAGTAAVLSALADPEQAFLVCMGSCASLDPDRAPVGGLYRIHALEDMASGIRYYPDMVFRTDLPESALLTGARVLTSENLPAVRQTHTSALYDMESAAVYASARLYIGPHRMLFLRHATDAGGETVTPEKLRSAADAHLDTFLEILRRYERFADRILSRKPEPDSGSLDELGRELRCSETMMIQLRQMHRYAQLTGFPWEAMVRELHRTDRLPVPGRKEGKDVLACIRTRLYTQTV